MWLAECLGVSVSGCQVVWLSGCQVVWLSGSLVVWFSGSERDSTAPKCVCLSLGARRSTGDWRLCSRSHSQRRKQMKTRRRRQRRCHIARLMRTRPEAAHCARRSAIVAAELRIVATMMRTMTFSPGHRPTLRRVRLCKMCDRPDATKRARTPAALYRLSAAPIKRPRPLVAAADERTCDDERAHNRAIARHLIVA